MKSGSAHGNAPRRVVIFVRNTFTVDARVAREASTFARAGYETTVIAVLGRGLPAREFRERFTVIRVPTSLTWRDAYPRTSKLFGAGRRSRERPPKPKIGPRLSSGGWVRWILIGRDPAPPSWTGASGGWFGARLLFALSLLGRVSTRLPTPIRRAAKAAGRSGRRTRARMRRGMLRPTRFRQVERRMADAAVALRPDICWANDADTLRPARAAAIRSGAKLVYDAHEVIWDDHSLTRRWRWRWNLVERTHIRDAARVFTVCDPIADLMARRYRIPRPIVLLNCPRLSETSAPPPAEASPLRIHALPGERIVLFHGSLSHHRGVEQLISAVGLLPGDVRLVVLGHGAYRPVLEDHARSAGVAHRVTFLSSVPSAELPAWVVGADVGTIPYLLVGRNHEYSTPNKLFEYMHLGVPVIANHLPQVERIVEEVGFGIVCDTSRPRELADAIATLLAEPGRYETMRKAALSGAARYCWEQQEQKILDAIATALPEGSHQNV